METETQSPNQFDVIIVGGACAGLAAATYAARRNLKTLVVTKDIGGQIATTPSVENYPSIDFISGPDLAQNMFTQALKWGATVEFDEVTAIAKRDERDFVVSGYTKQYHAKSLIMAYGKTPRSLEIPGEREYSGKGLSYCVTCDAPLYRGKTVAVVGGGNSAMEGALILAEICEKVFLVHRRDEFRGEEVLLERINTNPRIEKVLSVTPQAVKGNGNFVTHLSLNSVKDSSITELALQGIFVEIGFIVKTDLIKDFVELDRLNQVITNKKMETKTAGLYACGDLTDGPYKQAVISAGEGATAALSAYSYIHDKPAGVDWSGH